MIIGLVGRSRSGKDTVATLLQELNPARPFAIARLSAPIKDAARALFQFTDQQIEGAEKEVVDPRWNVTPRQVFQSITEHTMNAMGTDFFTRVFYEKYDQGILPPNVIIPDIRYDHDIQEIKRRNGLIFKVERDSLPVTYDCENHLDAYTTDDGLSIIPNHGSLETLRDTVWSQWNAAMAQSNRMR